MDHQALPKPEHKDKDKDVIDAGDLTWTPVTADSLKAVYYNKLSVGAGARITIDLPLPQGVSHITVVVEQDGALE